MNVNRRNFLIAGGVTALSGCVTKVIVNTPDTTRAPSPLPEVKTEEEPAVPKALIASAPVLQNAAETSMGVAFAVNDMANGYVKFSTSPDMAGAKKVKCGGFRVTGMNDKVMQIRLTGLKPDTKYYYTIGADRISYKGGYAMKIVGNEEDPKVYSFTTLGQTAKAHFCVINDTHAQPEAFQLCMDKIRELNPSCVVWNGDACNTQETIDSLLPIFFNPQIDNPAYAAEMPYLFVPGNHDNRGRAARELEKVWMFRQPEERSARDWDLGRNLAVRLGDLALIGLDTGEDKLDDRDVFAGLFNMEPYRVAQTEWLRDVLEREDIRSAKYKIAFCHIPLFDSNPKSNPGDVDKNGGGKYTHDFAIWQRTCANMWGPLFEKAGVEVVITAHNHRFRVDEAAPGHNWTHIVGGGPELGVKNHWTKEKGSWTTPDPGKFPTVIEGVVENGKLRVLVHDVFHKQVVFERTFG